jgi:hypothetical protein
MQTARITAAIRYSPTIAVFLLALAWSISVFSWMGAAFPPWETEGQFHIGIARGNVGIGFRTPITTAGIHWDRGPWVFDRQFVFGYFDNTWDYDSNDLGATRLVYGQADCPICCIITLLLPLAVGPFARFRFRLWMLLAWTAIIAAECAYFTRWAGPYGIE